MIGVAVFDGGPERIGKDYWGIEMKTIHTRPRTCPARANDRSAIEQVRERVVFETPGSEEIVFRAGPADGGLLRSIDEKHVVAFTPPVILVLQDRHSDAGILAASLGIQPHVVVLAGQVGLLVYYWLPIAGPFIGP